jgi:formylglycine-generating enzyme required for sulfatase activity
LPVRLEEAAVWILLAGAIVCGSPSAEGARGSSESAILGCTETILLAGDVPLVMVWIPEGTFMMGHYSDERDAHPDEGPQHPVTLSHGFWLGRYEVTKAQWQAVMGTTPWSGKKHVQNDRESPSVCISWEDVQAFITKLNHEMGRTFRLPTEAEWEYACRAGTATRFYWGDDPGYMDINDCAWWKANALNAEDKCARAVGMKRPNAWGLCDMSGNVFEWCQDWYGDYPSEPVTDPTGPSIGARRVERGGSWINIGGHCRSARRGHDPPSSAYNDVGFRLAR